VQAATARSCAPTPAPASRPCACLGAVPSPRALPAPGARCPPSPTAAAAFPPLLCPPPRLPLTKASGLPGSVFLPAALHFPLRNLLFHHPPWSPTPGSRQAISKLQHLGCSCPQPSATSPQPLAFLAPALPRPAAVASSSPASSFRHPRGTRAGARRRGSTRSEICTRSQRSVADAPGAARGTQEAMRLQWKRPSRPQPPLSARKGAPLPGAQADAAASTSTRGETQPEPRPPPCQLSLLRAPLSPPCIPRARGRSWAGASPASTRTARTRTPPLRPRDAPGKKHFIHPLNNSDNSILSPIYMFQTRYRCYENIANIQKYIHFKKQNQPHINYLQHTSGEMVLTKRPRPPGRLQPLLSPRPGEHRPAVPSARRGPGGCRDPQKSSLRRRRPPQRRCASRRDDAGGFRHGCGVVGAAGASSALAHFSLCFKQTKKKYCFCDILSRSC